ncbi:MAG TPA: hypothetical protein VNK43_00775 [Gemmatimonadales bacterium]|nr:hypothetical protein [Gemmatimonadales bacterium]
MTAAPAPADAPVRLGEVIIIGGGCYGTFYARQLAQAKRRGRAEFARLLVVDRDPDCRARRELGEGEDRRLVVADWAGFLDDYLAQAAVRRRSAPTGPVEDVIVPSPLMPHLLYEWLVRRARARWPGREIATAPMPLDPGTPYDAAAPDGTRFVSFADWLCPTHCIEPAICPVIRSPRTWEMSDRLAELVRRLDRRRPTVGPVLFVTRHRAFGVGDFPVASVLAGDELVADAGRSGDPVDVLVGTISACHGAVSLLRLGAA